MSDKVLFCCTPGYSKMTGYYYRVQRDKESLERLGLSVDIVVCSNFMSTLKIFLRSFFLRKYSHIFFQNIGASVPFVPAVLINRITGMNHYYLIYHGSLDDLASFRFYKFRRFIYKLTEFLLVTSKTKIICVSDYMKTYLCNMYKNFCDNFFVIPNIPSEGFIDSCTNLLNVSKHDLREKLHLPQDRFLICYAGNSQPWQKADLLCDLVKSLPNINFVILTLDVCFFKSRLTTACENVQILTVSNDAVPMYLRASDALYMLRDDNEVNRCSCPTKGVEYLLSATPIIISERIGDLSDEVAEAESGLVVPDYMLNDQDKLALLISSWANDACLAPGKIPDSIKNKYTIKMQDYAYNKILDL